MVYCCEDGRVRGHQSVNDFFRLACLNLNRFKKSCGRVLHVTPNSEIFERKTCWLVGCGKG